MSNVTFSRSRPPRVLMNSRVAGVPVVRPNPVRGPSEPVTLAAPTPVTAPRADATWPAVASYAIPAVVSICRTVSPVKWSWSAVPLMPRVSVSVLPTIASTPMSSVPIRISKVPDGRMNPSSTPIVVAPIARSVVIAVVMTSETVASLRCVSTTPFVDRTTVSVVPATFVT